MVPKAFVRQYAVSQQIDEAVADQEIVLHYALALLERDGLIGPGRTPPRRGRFSSRAAPRCANACSAARAVSPRTSTSMPPRTRLRRRNQRRPRHAQPLSRHPLSVHTFRHSEDGNFSGTFAYEHATARTRSSSRSATGLDPILEPRPLELVPQTYLKHVECGIPVLFGLDPYEMIGEKIMACNRRGISGSSKDVYDLYLWAQRPFDDRLARRLAVLKAWTDQRTKRPYEPQQFLDAILPKNFRWTDISRLVPRKHGADHQAICSTVRTRLGFLADCDDSSISPPKKLLV